MNPRYTFYCGVQLALAIYEEKLFASVCEIISNLDMEIIESLPENITMRLTESLLVSIVAMIEFHPDKDDDNISFLEYLLKIKTITKS